MIFTSSDAVIVRHLLEFPRCLIYDFHNLYLLSPAQIADSLDRLHQARISGNDHQYAYLLEDYEMRLAVCRRSLFQRSKGWRECPRGMRSEKMQVTAPYIPNRKLVDKRILRLSTPQL